MNGTKNSSQPEDIALTSPQVPSENNGNGKGNGSIKKFQFTNTKLSNIDYVLVYDKEILSKEPSLKGDKEMFLTKLKDEGLLIEEIKLCSLENLYFVLIQAPFKRLGIEAETINLPMPLEECELYEDCGVIEKLEKKYLVTDNEADYISIPFEFEKFTLFKGHQDIHTFFRSSLRNYLTHHILIHTDIRQEDEIAQDEIVHKKALPKLLHEGVFVDAFQLHDPSLCDKFFTIMKKRYCRYRGFPIECAINDTSSPPSACPGLKCISPVDEENAKSPKLRKKSLPEQHSTFHTEMHTQFLFQIPVDDRLDMDNTWLLWTKYQPLWKVRNYFGENIAFYFAWLGHLMAFLWLPLILGLAVFFYGIYENQRFMAVSKVNTSSNSANSTAGKVTQKLINNVDEMLSVFKGAFDNTATPFYAIAICVWSTVFTEYWKRYRLRLAYLWDVDDFVFLEPDRPAFIGTTKRKDPVTNKESFYFPFSQQFIRLSVSVSVLLVMIVIVFIAVVGVIVYRVVTSVAICPRLNTVECLIVNVIVSSLMNAVAILMLGKVYKILAMKLTDWENHRTETAYQNSLVIKLFAFEFVNSYSSLVYIAFFRGKNAVRQSNGIFGMGPDYVDNCGESQNCMSMLSIQVLILMATRPLPKLIFDIIIPFLLHLCRPFYNRILGRVEPKVLEGVPDPTDVKAYLLYEHEKPTLENFPLDEYMEKVIQYGFLALFAASFPLAPLLAQSMLLIDKHIDAKRMLWMYRRPVSWMAAGIGMWEPIINFINVCSVVSNAFLFAFTSSWAADFDIKDKLIIVMGVEHAVFIGKVFLSAVIPDVPSDIELAMRRERYQVAEILERRTSDNMSFHPSHFGHRSRKNEQLINANRLPFNDLKPDFESGDNNVEFTQV